MHRKEESNFQVAGGRAFRDNYFITYRNPAPKITRARECTPPASAAGLGFNNKEEEFMIGWTLEQKFHVQTKMRIVRLLRVLLLIRSKLTCPHRLILVLTETLCSLVRLINRDKFPLFIIAPPKGSALASGW